MVQQAPDPGGRASAPVVWRTCVREIALIDAADDVPTSGQIWHDEDAYAHLLEVVCGLDSPIVGETEVLHQFKMFSDSLSPEHCEWRELCRAVLADARAIRSHHLIGLGSRSYGSAVRRHLRSCGRVAVIGTGMLAQQVLPFAADAGRIVDLWGRRPACPIPSPPATYRALADPVGAPFEEPCAIVVAAPIASSGIAALARRYANIVAVIDLRAEGAQDAPPRIGTVITLADIFAEFDRAAEMTNARVAAARQEVRRCARAFAARTKLNPSGWHDLCA